MKEVIRYITLLFVVVFIVPPFNVYALEGEDVISLEDIVVTATRDKEEIRKVPANVTVITAEDIEKSGAVTVVDALQNLEGIHFRTFSGNASQSQIDIRGFGENSFARTLVLLDGKRLNRPDLASVNWLQVPLGSVERIEVVRGSGNVLYGDSAIAGVINIITKKGKGKLNPSITAIAGSYGLHNERVGITGSDGKVSYAFNGENLKTFGYREKSKFSSKGAALGLQLDASDYLNISFGLSLNETDLAMPGNLTEKEIEQNRRQFQPARPPFGLSHSDDEASNDYLDTNLKIESVLGDYGNVEIDFFYGQKSLETDFASFSSFTEVDIDTFGITPKYIFERDIWGHNNRFMFGLDYYNETLDKDTFSDVERSSTTFVAELTRESLGYYIQDEYNVFEELIVNVGYRNERSETKGNETDTLTQTEAFDAKKIHEGEAYEASLIYLFGERSKIFTKYARVYRYPLLDEQASYFSYLLTDTFYADLEKEKGDSYEIGTQYYPCENLKISMSLFKIDMEDEIAYVVDPLTWIGRNENLDKTRHQGVEFALSYRVKKLLNVYGNVTYQEAEFREGANEGNEIPLVPKTKANAGLEIYLPYDLVLRPEVRYTGKSYFGSDNDNSSEKLGDYTTYDLFLFYRPEFDGVKLSAFAGIENLTDEMYSTTGYEGVPDNVFYPSPGITIKGGISVYF